MPADTTPHRFCTPSAAADRWARELAGWGIPEAILRQAESSPWGWPRSRLRRTYDESAPTLRAARDGLGERGTVLDVGVGAGWGSLSLVPPATRLVGVDSDPDMLVAFVANCRERGVDHDAVEGAWPDVASRVDAAEVVVCANVVYNVAAIVPFVRALSSRATRRVVVECTAQHPTAWMAPLWQRFHGLSRPHGPTADDLIGVMELCVGSVQVERWRAPTQPADDDDEAERAEFVTRRLCLPARRSGEVAEALHTVARDGERVTLWWDAEAPSAGHPDHGEDPATMSIPPQRS